MDLNQLLKNTTCEGNYGSGQRILSWIKCFASLSKIQLPQIALMNTDILVNSKQIDSLPEKERGTYLL